MGLELVTLRSRVVWSLDWASQAPLILAFNIYPYTVLGHFQKYLNDFFIIGNFTPHGPPAQLFVSLYIFLLFMKLQSQFLCNSEFYFPSVMATKYYFINFHFTPRLASVNSSACWPFPWASMPRFSLGEILFPLAFSLVPSQFHIMIMKIY